MGLLESIFGKRKTDKQLKEYFKLLSSYAPVFTTRNGGVYEMQLTRACIHATAAHCSKLQARITGTAYNNLSGALTWQPNEWQSTSQFLYRTATILHTDNTCYIVPIIDDNTGWISGYFPILPAMTEILTDEYGEAWLRYTFSNGEKAAMEFSRVGVLVNHQYKNEIVGEKNDALNPTLDLIHAQNEGILRGIENASSYKFYARSNNFALEKDLKAEANNFSRENFGNEAGGAVLIFPNTYDDIKQIQQASNNIVDPEQLKIIRQNVFDYFGCNEEIIQNKAVGDSWSAFYEGRIEPFAVQLSQVMTNMTYTAREKACGNAIYWTASRVQTMSNQQKLEYSTQMFDRGLASRNDIMDVWGMPPVPDGDRYYIRKEYIAVDQIDRINIDSLKESTEPKERDPDDNT